MVTRFGSREICDVTFKALTSDMTVGNKTFKAGQPVFVIDTATASNMEQATTTVYAQGGKGYNRLIAWEGEKTLTFTVTDALMSPLGLKVLTGAGLADENAVKHVHVTYDVSLDAAGKATISAKNLCAELGIKAGTTVKVCNDTEAKPYATVLDGNGAIVDWVDAEDITLSGKADALKANLIDVDAENDLEIEVADAENKTIKLDFYVYLTTGATEITIAPEDFGGFFYVEADTLYRNQDGKDMAATLTFPKVKIQSGFTIAMAPTGDPSTFDFVMDCFPAYTYFDRAKKVVCQFDIISGEDTAEDAAKHSTPVEHGDSAEVIQAKQDLAEATTNTEKVTAAKAIVTDESKNYSGADADEILAAINADLTNGVVATWKTDAPTVTGTANVTLTSGTGKNAKAEDVVVNVTFTA